MGVHGIDLGPTETYRERVGVYVSGIATPSDGILTVTTRAGNRTTTVTYAVDRVKERDHLLVHLRPLRAGGDGPYWVDFRNGHWSCNCRGFKPAESLCKHCSSVKCLVEKKLI